MAGIQINRGCTCRFQEIPPSSVSHLGCAQTARVVSSALTCSSGRLSATAPEMLRPCYVLPPPKVLVTASHRRLWGKRPPWQCSRPPRDALTDDKLCMAEPECVQEDRTLTYHGLPSLQNLAADAPPCHAKAASSSRYHEPPVCLGQEPPQLEGPAQPTKNTLKEAKRARCLQPGFCKGNHGACHLKSVCSFTLSTGEVPCSNVQLETWVKKPRRRLFLAL